MATERFKKGDLVRLRSGGPTMTVNRYDGKDWDCAWFVDNTFGHATFSEAALVASKDEVRGPTIVLPEDKDE